MQIGPIPLNRHNFKLVVALAIPVLIGSIFLYSQNLANQEVAKYRAEQKINPTASRISVKNYELKEVDGANHLRWHLTATSGILGENGKEVDLTNVKVEYFNGPVVRMCLIAPSGQANEETRYVKLLGSGQQKVQAKGDGGKVSLTAFSVELMKNNHFLASGDVNIEWPGVAKVWSDTASGKVNLSDCKEFKLSGNTRALVYIRS